MTTHRRPPGICRGRPYLIAHTKAPDGPLAGLVDVIWHYAGYAPPHPSERLLPDGSAELVINLSGPPMRVASGPQPSRWDSFPDAVLCGPHAECFVIDTAQPAVLLGIHFRPGGASPFLGLPADELRNRHVPLDALWGPAAAALLDRLREASGPAARFAIIERALLARAGAPQRHPAVAYALDAFTRAPHAHTVAAVTEQVGLSARRFTQLFRAQVGLTPKRFCRVRRFQRVLDQIERCQPVEWAGVALDCGYFDQAHLIHDFRAFSGLSPTGYLLHHGRHRNHVPLG